MNISPLLFLVSDGDRPLPPGHSTLRHRDFTRAPSLPAQDQPSPPDRKPRLFNKRIILWGTEKCCRNVTAVRYDRRARRAERVGQSFVRIGVRMQLRRSRTRSPVTRERYRGYLRKQASHPTLYKDHQPPTTQLGFPPCKIAATPLTKLQICSTPWPPPPANSGEPPPRRPTSSSSPRALLFLFSLSLTSCFFFFLAAATMTAMDAMGAQAWSSWPRAPWPCPAPIRPDPAAPASPPPTPGL